MVPLRYVTFTINVLGDASIAPLGIFIIPCKIPKQNRSPIATILRHLIRTAGAYLSESMFSVILPKDDSFFDNWLLSFDSHLDTFRRVKKKN